MIKLFNTGSKMMYNECLLLDPLGTSFCESSVLKMSLKMLMVLERLNFYLLY